MEINLNRNVKIPDPLKVERYRRSPELGPKILFFSGGSALKGVSKKLIEYTYNSFHIITPFDSGGSSAKIREAFKMMAVGDLRNRLMALADQKVKGNPAIYDLFSYRLPKKEKEGLINIIYEMIQGTHPLVIDIPNPMQTIICNHLRFFINKMPINFDLRGANIGNLVLTGGYLNNNDDIEAVLFIFSKLVESHGLVKPVINKNLNLVAALENGSIVKGQSLITGRDFPKITSPIKNLYLTENLNHPLPYKVEIKESVKKIIKKAELICYPMGSFYTSLIANLIPKGIGSSVAENICPKVYIPNTFSDPEQLGLNLLDSIKTLLKYLEKESPLQGIKKYINFILLDSKNGSYPFDLNLPEIKKLGVELIDTKLISQASHPYVDPDLLIKVLLSLT